MDDDPQIQTGSIQHDQPAGSHAETREETIARVVDPDEAVGAERGGSPDPSSRRGLGRTMAGSVIGFGLVGAVVGAVAGFVLSLLPGPFETDSVAGAIGYTAALAAAGALIAAVIGTLLTLAREDGRVEREVEESTGRGPEGVAGPIAPEHDLTER